MREIFLHKLLDYFLLQVYIKEMIFMHKKGLTLIILVYYIMTEKKVLELSISNYSCTTVSIILASVVGGNAEQIT